MTFPAMKKDISVANVYGMARDFVVMLLLSVAAYLVFVLITNSVP
jgi:hypothetical protein